MTTSTTRAAAFCALLATTALASPAFAQAASQPAYRNFDANGVDLVRGDYVLSFVEGSIGSGEAELPLIRRAGSASGGASQWDGIGFQKTTSSTGEETVTVTLGNKSETFTGSNGSYTSSLGVGSTLTGSGSSFTYTMRDGTKIVFSDPSGNPNSGATNFCKGSGQPSCSLLPTEISSPDAKTVELSWTLHEKCSTEFNPDGSLDCEYFWRLGGVANSFGYSIAFAYTTDTVPSTGPTGDWYQRTGASFFNNAVSTAAQAKVSYSYPSSGVTEVTDIGGRTWRVSGGSIRRPGAASDSIVVTTDANGTVSSVANDGVTTNYARSVSGNTATMTVTDALNRQTVVVSDLAISRPTSVTDPLNRKTSFQYDANGRLTRATAPEGNAVQYTLDARGNATETRRVAKPNSGQPDIVTSATFDASCTVAAKCNQPNSTTDPRGAVTDYDYDGTHGGVVSIKLPAAPNGVRPETRFAYALVNGEHRLASVSACRTQASCAGSADEVKSSFSYDANGNVTGISSGAGDGSLTATEARTYDASGNLVAVDGPLSGSADTTRYRYNAARELIGTVSPDPDGGGALKHRATRNSFNASGLLAKVENGTVNSQSDADWAAMSVADALEIGYDANARPLTQKLVSGTTAHALAQTSYDALGRTECVARRMNPAAFGTLPSSACTLGTEGSFGPDRINRTVYDAAGQVTEVRTAVGTASEAAEVASTYTANGKVATATDGENNKTTYEHDGHDRLARTLFPSPTKGAGTSNANDYEQRSYDAASSVTAFRNRAGETIGFSYDNLGRLTLKDLPGTEPDVSFAYDLLGRMTSASQSGHSLSFAYDALGRKVGETGPHGTVASTYDIAGRRTRLTHADGFAVDHNYLVTGEMTQIVQPGDPTNPFAGNTVLVSFGYDDLGRRTSLTRLNGTSTSYSHDPVSRLSQLVQDAGGTDRDLTLGFSYNPASQIATNSRSNDAYAFTAHTSGTITETPNGLNQLVNRAGTSISYDAKGNVTFDPTTGSSFAYSSENLLRSVSIGSFTGSLGYDPLMRLYQSGSTRTGYDGQDRIAEYNGAGTQTLRFVHGPGVDEPLIEYGGSGLATRKFLHADERGSVVAGSDDAGTVTAVTKYDEYGQAQDQFSRFGYTGQPYETMTDLIYSRARMYNPRLGRFMQPDPIGYDDGMNLYAYVGGDPVNFTDPSGLQTCAEVIAKVQGPNQAVVCGRRGGGGRGSGGFRGSGGVGGSGGSGGPGGGGGGGAAPQPMEQAKDEDSCAQVLKERRGTIVARGITATAILGLGITVTKGSFRNTSTGSTGNFLSVGLGAGALAGLTETESTFKDLGSFIGFADSVSLGFPLPFASRIPLVGKFLSKRIGLGGTVHQNLVGDRVGKSSDVGPGRSGLASTMTETTISQCNVGG